MVGNRQQRGRSPPRYTDRSAQKHRRTYEIASLSPTRLVKTSRFWLTGPFFCHPLCRDPQRPLAGIIAAGLRRRQLLHHRWPCPLVGSQGQHRKVPRPKHARPGRRIPLHTHLWPPHSCRRQVGHQRRNLPRKPRGRKPKRDHHGPQFRLRLPAGRMRNRHGPFRHDIGRPMRALTH